MEPMEIIEGVRRGSSVYVYQDFIYRLNRENKGIKYLKCQRRGCKGKAKLEGQNFSMRFEHGHEMEDVHIKKLRLRAYLKRKAAKIVGSNITCSMRRVFNDACATLDLDEPLIEFENIRSSLYRSRRSAMPPMPSNLAEYASILDQYYDWGTTIENSSSPFYQKFIQNEEDSWSAVFFTSKTLTELLSQSLHVVLDTSFKALPRQLNACEMLTVHGVFMNHLFPAVFILISRVTKSSYEGILEEVLSNLCPESRDVAEIVVSNHDKLIRDAAVSAWPEATHLGCIFHYAQAVYQKHAKLKLTHLTECNTHAAKALRMLMVWAFLPANLLKTGLNEISLFIQTNNLEKPFTKMLHYMTNYWVNTVGLISTSVFNQDHMISFEIENYYHQMVDRMGPLPGVWDFTAKLGDLENNLVLDIEKLIKREPILRPRKAISIKIDSVIRSSSIKLETEKCTIREFLEKLATTVKYLESRFRRPQYPAFKTLTVSKPADTPKYFNVENVQLIKKNKTVTKKIARTQKDQESVYGEPACVSCLHNKPVYKVTPCGHMNICGACKASHTEFGIFDREGRRLEMCCPQCRTPVLSNSEL